MDETKKTNFNVFGVVTAGMVITTVTGLMKRGSSTHIQF